MNKKIFTFIILVAVYGCDSVQSFAEDNYSLLEPDTRYSDCTAWESGYSIGILGDTWALTLSFPKNRFSGKVQAQKAKFYQGPGIHKYIAESAGPVRPPLPKTKEYIAEELVGITVNIKRVKVFDKVMGPIEITVNDFLSHRQRFHIPGKIKIFCRSPLP